MSTVDKYTLKPSLTERFEGIIWKIETDDNEPIIAIETRNVADRKTFYSAFNYVSGECLFKEITVENSWLWGLARVHDGVVLLHSYKNDNSPEHAGIVALNSSGQIAWTQYNRTLEDVTDLGLLVYNPKIEPKVFDLISVISGQILAGTSSLFTSLFQEVILPDIRIDTGNTECSLPQNISVPFFHKHYNQKDIFVYHTQVQNLFTQQLVVCQAGKTILEDNLAVDIPKMNPEAFFIQRNHLFYIRNSKQEFVSYLV